MGATATGNCPRQGAMFAFAPTQTSGDPAIAKPELYRELLCAAGALTEGETDATANMANLAALIWTYLPDLNWAGFYRLAPDAGELVLGPFIGKPACIRIPLGSGVCGTAAASARSQCVADVHAFPGHIACDADSRSELVVPVIVSGRVIAVIDLDSPRAARFDPDDTAGIEALALAIGTRIES
jgi:L-methionine (R)-S-oxide reductase